MKTELLSNQAEPLLSPEDEKYGVTYGKLYMGKEIRNFICNGLTHGTHVASIAAGRAVNKFSGGMAPKAKVVAVIPRTRVDWLDPNSLGYSVSHLDAFRFIKEFAEQQKMPVVVNLSQGTNAGAHDGQTLLEAGIDALSLGGREPGFVIVKSAGNERASRHHMRLRIETGTKTISWQSHDCRLPGASDAQSSEDYLELWFPGCDDIEFELTPSQGGPGLTVNSRQTTCRGQFGNPTVHYRVHLARNHHDNGESRLTIRVWYGNHVATVDWNLVLNIRHARSNALIDAWIERMHGRSAQFKKNNEIDCCTVTVPGTARSVITVGASERNGFPAAQFSSTGPTRDGRNKPDIYAPGADIAAALAGSTDQVATMSGTSMAAPHVTGAIALLLSRHEKQRQIAPQLNAVQLGAALRYSAAGFNGQWKPDQGFGMLDTKALVTYFDDPR